MNKILLCFLVVVAAGCQPTSKKVEEKAAQENAQVDAKQASVLLFAQSQQFLAQGNVKEAVGALRSSLQADAKNTQSYLSLSEIFMRLGKFPDAQMVLEQAIKNVEANGNVFYLLSVAHQQQGRLVPAVLAARQSAELFQKSRDEDNFKKSMILVQTLVKEAQAQPAPAPAAITPQETSTVTHLPEAVAMPVEETPVPKNRQNFGPR